MHVSKKMLTERFEQFVKDIGGWVATSYDDVGGFGIETLPNGKYYQVFIISNKTGGLRHVFGSSGRDAIEWSAIFLSARTIVETYANIKGYMEQQGLSRREAVLKTFGLEG